MKTLRYVLLLFALAVPLACASNLPEQLTDNTPRAVEVEVDLSQVYFLDIATEQPVNVADYMAVNDRDYLLLTFGSEGCASCDKKARELEAEVIGKDPLFLTDKGSRLEIIGVNTDSLNERSTRAYLSDFNFIRWNDERGEAMVQYFMPEGYTFSVPLTVLVVEGGLAWRIPPDEPTTVDEIMARVRSYIEGEPSGDDGSGDDGDGGGLDAADGGDDHDDDTDGGDGDADDTGGDDGLIDGSDGDVSDPTQLHVMAPGRLKQVAIIDCDGEEHKLHDVLGDVDMRFVQVAKSTCDNTCQDNAVALSDVAFGCEAGVSAANGKTCATVNLVAGELSADDCARGDTFSADTDEFFRIFDTHFYRPPIEDGWDLLPGPLDGPLTFAFSGEGPLAYSANGEVDRSSLELLTLVGTADENTVATGPNFPIYSQEDGEIAFSTVRKQFDLTILSVFEGSPVCGSCLMELRHWSEDGELVDLCEDTGRCTMLAMEMNQFHGSDPSGLDQWIDELKNSPDPFGGPGLMWDGVDIPLILDPVPMADELNRYFQGYLSTLTASRVSKTVVYNREGRIVKIHDPTVSTEDEVTPFVKQYLGLED